MSVTLKQRKCGKCLCYDHDSMKCTAYKKGMKPDGYCIVNGIDGKPIFIV